MGGGSFGASRRRSSTSGKSVKDVTLAEAAMLAGLFKGAIEIRPAQQPAGRPRPRRATFSRTSSMPAT